MPKEKLLIVELWGIGDLVLATPFLRLAAERFDLTILGKRHARAVLEGTFPHASFIEWDAPWTVFRGKYHFWRWDWRALFGVVRAVRARHFDRAVSVRKDPRDHLLMWLAGARRRIGFTTRGSGIFLTDSVPVDGLPTQHVTEDWRTLAGLLFGAGATAGPWRVELEREPGLTERVRHLLEGKGQPLICLHTGARIAVRRWPESYFRELITQLRAQFDFRLLLIPDPDGYGRSLGDIADETAENLTIEEMTAVIAGADLLLCNDSAPAHIAAATSTPVIAIFGPTDPRRFGPWSETSHVVIRDICPYRPCFDYCRFPEPYCLTKLAPAEVGPEVCAQITSLVGRGVLSEAILKDQTKVNV